MSRRHDEDNDLAYGEETEHTTGRGFVGDVIGKLSDLKQYGNKVTKARHRRTKLHPDASAV